MAIQQVPDIWTYLTQGGQGVIDKKQRDADIARAEKLRQDEMKRQDELRAQDMEQRRKDMIAQIMVSNPGSFNAGDINKRLEGLGYTGINFQPGQSEQQRNILANPQGTPRTTQAQVFGPSTVGPRSIQQAPTPWSDEQLTAAGMPDSITKILKNLNAKKAQAQSAGIDQGGAVASAITGVPTAQVATAGERAITNPILAEDAKNFAWEQLSKKDPKTGKYLDTNTAALLAFQAYQKVNPTATDADKPAFFTAAEQAAMARREMDQKDAEISTRIRQMSDQTNRDQTQNLNNLMDSVDSQIKTLQGQLPKEYMMMGSQSRPAYLAANPGHINDAHKLQALEALSVKLHAQGVSRLNMPVVTPPPGGVTKAAPAAASKVDLSAVSSYVGTLPQAQRSAYFKAALAQGKLSQADYNTLIAQFKIKP